MLGAIISKEVRWKLTIFELYFAKTRDYYCTSHLKIAVLIVYSMPNHNHNNNIIISDGSMKNTQNSTSTGKSGK